MKEGELAHAYRNAGMDASHLVRDPAHGVAIAKCLLHRILGANKLGNIRSYHPMPCRYCQVDRANLQTIYDEWMKWSMLDRDEVSVPSPVEAFMGLDADVQEQLVRRAQGYEEANANTDHLPKGASDPDQDPAGRDQDDRQAGSNERNIDHRPASSVRVTGGAPRRVRTTRPGIGEG